MKRILSILIASIMILSSVVSFADTAKSVVFTDVDPQTEAGKAILKLADAGIVNGNGDGTYAPKRNVTRAELCKMINNIKNYTEEDETAFSDVTSDKWYYFHVKIAKKAGYINGFEDGTFRGDQYVTREQVCAILVRVLGLYDLGLPVTINDSVSPWAENYVKIVVSNALIGLEEGNLFRATQDMTREELALPLANFVIESSDDVDVPEIKEDNKDDDNKDDKKENNKTNGGSGGGFGGGSGGGSGSGSSGNKNDKNESPDEGDEEGSVDEGDEEGSVDEGDEEGSVDEGDEEGSVDEGDEEGSVDEGDEEVFDESLQKEVKEKLEKLLEELDYIATLPWVEFTDSENIIIASIKETVGKTLEDAQAGKWIYVEDYVLKTYNDDVMSVRSMYNALDDAQVEEFKTKLGELPLYLIEYLAGTMFGVDITEYM